jgi:hypothetical protein
VRDGGNNLAGTRYVETLDRKAALVVAYGADEAVRVQMDSTEKIATKLTREKRAFALILSKVLQNNINKLPQIEFSSYKTYYK